MSETACPLCTLDEILVLEDHNECVTCGHEWKSETPSEDEAPVELVVKDAHGNILQNGDTVAMIKDLKLKGTSQTLKTGTKSKPIRLREGDHEIDCKMNGLSIALKAIFVKKVQ